MPRRAPAKCAVSSTDADILERARALCLSLPETSEKISWGHPNFRAGKKMFVAFERIQGKPSIAFRLPPGDVQRLLQRKPFFITPYGRGQWVSVWVDDGLEWALVASLVPRSYRVVALKRMLNALSTESPSR